MTSEFDTNDMAIDENGIAEQIKAAALSRRQAVEASDYSRSQFERIFKNLYDPDADWPEKVKAAFTSAQIYPMPIDSVFLSPERIGGVFHFEVPEDPRAIVLAVAQNHHIGVGSVSLKTIANDHEKNKLVIDAMKVGAGLHPREDTWFPDMLESANHFFLDCVPQLKKNGFKVEALIRVGYGVHQKKLHATNVIEIVIRPEGAETDIAAAETKPPELTETLIEHKDQIAEAHRRLSKQMREFIPPEPIENSFNYYRNLGFPLPKIPQSALDEPHKKEKESVGSKTSIPKTIEGDNTDSQIIEGDFREIRANKTTKQGQIEPPQDNDQDTLRGPRTAGSDKGRRDK